MSGPFTLFQIADSAFPSGSFAHSYGLETLFENRGRDTPLGELRDAIAGAWRRQLASLDAVAGIRAWAAMKGGDVDTAVTIDRDLLSTKIARELREASVATGRSFLSVARTIVVHAGLEAFADQAERGQTPGNFSVAFHVTAAAAGVEARAAATAYGYQSVAQMVSSLVRLGLLGHRHAQSMLASFGSEIMAGIDAALADPRRDPSSFAPALEIASMRHERQYSRLFRS